MQFCNTTQFFTKKRHACVQGRRKVFARGGSPVDFSKGFLRGAKRGEYCFSPNKIKKTAFLTEIFKFLPLFRHPYACVGKVRATPIKILGNFKRFNTTPNS